MITLFVIVVIATFVLAATRAEGMRPLGLALVGMISIVLGARATAVFTETSVAPLVDAIVFAQENAEDRAATSDRDASDSDIPAEETPEAPVAADAPESADPTSTESEEADADTSPAAIEEADADDTPVETSEPGSDAATDSGDTAASTPVTVEAITNVKYLDRDEDAPSWLETKPWTEDDVHFVPVVSRLQISQLDRDEALTREIKQATNAYINQLLKNKHATTLLKLHSANSAPRVTESFKEQVVVTAGTMHQAHALVAFDDNFRDAISAEWAEVRATSRLMQTGLGAGIVILLLSTMFGYFKLDTATRGYYTGRLQFAAAAAILAVIAASVLFANYVPWM